MGFGDGVAIDDPLDEARARSRSRKRKEAQERMAKSVAQVATGSVVNEGGKTPAQKAKEMLLREKEKARLKKLAREEARQREEDSKIAQSVERAKDPDTQDKTKYKRY